MKNLQLLPPPGTTAEPPFLRQNWARLLASTDDWNLRYVRVQDYVATVTNGWTMLRSRINAADGFYTLTASNDLRPVRPRAGYLDKPFPDVEAMKPDLKNMRPFAQFSAEHLRHLVNFAEQARILEDIIMIDGAGLSMVNHPKSIIPCALEGVDEILVRPCQLKLALVEMLRYDHADFLKEDMTPDTPLVIGRGWDSCALVRVIRP